MQLKNIILINVILTLIEIKEIKSFKCGSKYLNLTPGILDTENKIKIRRIEGEENEEKEFQKLVIGYDYFLFNKSTEVKDDIKNTTKKLLEEVSEIFYKLLSVKKFEIHINKESLKELINARCKINETSDNNK